MWIFSSKGGFHDPWRVEIVLDIGSVVFALLTTNEANAWKIIPQDGVFIYPRIDGVGYLVREEPTALGQVVTAQAEKSILLGEGEIVYVDVGAKQGVRVGDRFLAYRIARPRELRYHKVIVVLGRLRVTEVGEEECAAVVEEAYRAVSLGAYVVQYSQLDPRIPLSMPPANLRGRIMWSQEGQITLGKGDIVFLDRGTLAGLEPGQCLRIYRVPMEGTEKPIPLTKRSYLAQKPPLKKHLVSYVGELMVLRVRQDTATALITKSLLPIEIGDRFMAGCPWQRALVAKERPVTPEKRPAVPPEEVERQLREKFENEDIHFAFDSYALTPRAVEILKEKAAFLKARPGLKVLIEGHCDERGTEQYNLALGDRRAHVAKEFLKALGIDPSRIQTVSYGEERPLDPRHNEEAWAKNRRAHFVIID